MTDAPDATIALADALDLVDQLERRCCDPGRSPRMAGIRDAIERAKALVEEAGEPATVAHLLEDAGAQVGRLQIGCCAPGRFPLYAGVLEHLTTAQLRMGPDMHAD